MKLRDYQLKAHAELEDAYRRQKSPLVLMSTGSGKSKTMFGFIKKHKAHFNFVVLVKTRKLVEQLKEDAKLFNLDYGVFMANHKELDTFMPVQICSIDTITARDTYPLEADSKDLIVLIDEADESISEGYQKAIARYKHRAIINNHGGRTFVAGFTATAFDRALTHFDEVIEPITPLELLEKGYLVDFEYYPCKVKIDYSDVAIEKGTWAVRDIEKKMNTPFMIRECYNAWKMYGDYRQTLVFCNSISHANNFCDYVNETEKGIVAAVVTGKTSDEKREEIYNKFEKGIIRFLINVRVVTRGVDFPIIGTILDMAATLKKNLHRQKIGRGSRPNPFYKNCRVLDPCNNNENCGHFYMKLEPLLKEDSKPTREVLNMPLSKTCDKCFKAFTPQSECPFCGNPIDLPPPPKISKTKAESLRLEKMTPQQLEQRAMIKEFKKELWKFQNIKRKFPRQIAKKKAIIFLLKKYGPDQCQKIKKSIGLTDEILKEFNTLHNYKPLGGLDL